MPTPQGAKRTGARVEGEVGVDPADRHLPSDDAPEVQYGGRVGGGQDTGARADRVRRAVADLRDGMAERGRRALRRLRAEHAAGAATANAEVELLTAAVCAACGGDVGRAVLFETDSVVLTAWAHHVRSVEADHPVRQVRP